MNKKQLVYLAGPITDYSYADATGWRNDVIKQFPDWIQGVSPLRKKEYLQGEKSIALDYPDVPLSCGRGIFTRDKFDVYRADLIFANLLGMTRPSIGTIMEITWANALNKPVVVVMEDSGNAHEHPMLKECIGFRLNNLKDAIDITIAVLSTGF